jgi:hypothetical protein
MWRVSPSRLGSTLALGVFVLVALLPAGCSRPVGSVSGKVTYQGKPLKGGSVSFVSDDGGRSYASGIKEDGTYTVPDLQGGSYKVCVETASLKAGDQAGGGYAPKGAAIPKGKMGPPPDAPVPEGYTPSDPAAAALAANRRKYVQIPDKYAQPDTTDLTYKFEGGTQTHDIDLK